MTEATTTAPFRRTVTVGKIDTGYATPAAVTVEIKYDAAGELHITGTAKRPGAADIDQGGQMQDTIAAMPAADLTMSEADRDELVALWERWHLNRLRPECEHQRAAGWREQAAEEVTLYHWRVRRDLATQVRAAERAAVEALRRGETVTLDAETRAIADAADKLTTGSPEPPSPLYEPATPAYQGDTYNKPTETKTRGWVKPSEHPDGLLTKPCPECGYGYGTAWLAEDVPADVLNRLRYLGRSVRRVDA